MDEVQKQHDIRAESADLNDMLEKLVEGEAESALLFEPYRRVALCAGMDIGPMVIGLLTASILLRNGQATDEDEQIFMAAASLNDRDFYDFVRWFNEAAENKMRSKPPLPSIPVIQSAAAATRVTSSLIRVAFSKGDTPINCSTKSVHSRPNSKTSVYYWSLHIALIKQEIQTKSRIS